MWFERDLSLNIQSLRPNTVGILRGPRQTGKTALLLKALGTQARLIECDDLTVRTRLNEDPSLFLGELTAPLILDEAHYCPAVFPELKLRVDRAKRNELTLPPIWITASNQTLMDSSVRETLAGRSQFFFLNPLSVHELGDSFQIRENLLRGGWPELNAHPNLAFASYLDDFIRTFVERDIARSSGVTKLGEFLQALRLMAARTGYTVNASEVGGEIGVKGETFFSWIQILERNGIVTLVPAFSNNLNKRLIKTPKLFFNDVGLASRLQGWQSAEPLILSPMVGPLFETLIFSELLKCRDHFGLPIEIFHYRNKEHEEVDFIIQGHSKTRGPIQLALEVKFAQQSIPRLKWPKSLESDLKNLTGKWVVTLNPMDPYTDSDGHRFVSVRHLAVELGQWLE